MVKVDVKMVEHVFKKILNVQEYQFVNVHFVIMDLIVKSIQMFIVYHLMRFLLFKFYQIFN